MKYAFRFVSLVVCSASLSAAYAGQAYDLKRVAKIGEAIKYRATADFVVQGQKISASWMQTDKVVKIDDQGNIVTESTQSEFKVGGQEIGQQDAPVTTATTKPNGEIVELKGDRIDSKTYRLANMNVLRTPDQPVKVGDKWSYEVKPDVKTGSVKGRADYEALAEEKVAGFTTLKIKWTYKEADGPNGASTDGIAWISTKDGSLVKAAASFSHAPVAGMPPTDMKFTVERA